MKGLLFILLSFHIFADDLSGDPLAQLPFFNEGIQAALDSPSKFCAIPNMADKTYTFPLYKRTELKGLPYAIFCWHANKKLIGVGHSATTFFLVDQKKSSNKKLISEKRISVSSWPIKNQVEWNGKKEDTYLHFNGSADYIGHFVDKDEKTAETICVPITKEEGENLAKYLFEVKDNLWSLSNNCNDFSRNMFSVIGVHVDTDLFSKKVCEKEKRFNIISTAKHVMKGMTEVKEKMSLDKDVSFEFNISTEELDAVNSQPQ
jgi:hypothetical protein